MATVVPPRSAKRQRLADQAADRGAQALADEGKLGPKAQNVIVQFRHAEHDEVLGPAISLPSDTGAKGLEMLVNKLRAQEEDPVPFAFHIQLPAPSASDATTASTPQRLPISNSIALDVLSSPLAIKAGLSVEDVLTIVCEPQAVFRVRPVTRCTSTLSGHGSPILCSVFSPLGDLLITGSGDATARIWDLNSETPKYTLAGHRSWVLCAEWEGRQTRVATGGMDGEVWVWEMPAVGRRPATADDVDGQPSPENIEEGDTAAKKEKKKRLWAQPEGKVLRGHSKWVTSLAWEPIHLNPASPRLASSSKDGTVRVWDVVRRTTVFTLGGHTASVNQLRWGGGGLDSFGKDGHGGIIYTASSDRTVRVWDGKDGKLIRVLNEHAHWVNTLALSTDFVLRTGPFDWTGKKPKDDEEARTMALARYTKALSAMPSNAELVITGSDDHTLFLWSPLASQNPKKPLARLTGHQKTVNHVAFSPDGRLIASAGFDNTVKLWDGRTGKFIASLRGHVAAVYRVAWSSDSRMLVSASKDTTLKLWDLKTYKIRVDLPGHTDEVYCVDFIADKVASGGRDKQLKIWRH